MERKKLVEVGAVKRLMTSSGGIHLHQKNTEHLWHEVFLVSATTQWKLGAEVLGVIVQRLRGFLDDRHTLPDDLPDDGKGWKWIATFAEEHGTLYARKLDGRYALKGRTDAGVLTTIWLDERDVTSWYAEIGSWR